MTERTDPKVHVSYADTDRRIRANARMVAQGKGLDDNGTHAYTRRVMNRVRAMRRTYCGLDISEPAFTQWLDRVLREVLK